MSARIPVAAPVAFARLLRVPMILARAWQRRRMVGRLGALDDHLLADIGITRQDVMSVLAEPLFADPSEKLAERAQEARHARRAMVREAQMQSDAYLAPLVPDAGRRAA